MEETTGQKYNVRIC